MYGAYTLPRRKVAYRRDISAIRDSPLLRFSAAGRTRYPPPPLFLSLPGGEL